MKIERVNTYGKGLRQSLCNGSFQEREAERFPHTALSPEPKDHKKSSLTSSLLSKGTEARMAANKK